MAAFLLLVHLVGPRARRNSQLFSAAQSRKQAAVLFDLAAKMVRMNPAMGAAIKIKDSTKELICPELGTYYHALSADAPTAMGLSPVFAVHDELGQVKGPRSQLYEAIETGASAHDQPMSVIISTQAPTDADLLSMLIDDAKTGADPKVKLSLFTSDPDADQFAKETIRQANPAFGDFQNAEEVLAMAADAERMPSRESEYRNLILNQRVDVNSPFISQSIWRANGSATSEWGQEEVYAGLDLSSTADLTAFVPVAKVDGEWETKPTFWLPEDGIEAKSRNDRVPYDLWASQGFLNLCPGKSVDYEFVAHWLFAFCQGHNVKKIAFDRWGMKYLRPWLIAAGFTDEQVDLLFEEFGQGFQSMSPALRDLESVLLNGQLRHANHPVLTMCAANAVVSTDPAGGRKLNKAKAAGRIDGMVALAMAFGVAPLEAEQPLDVMAMIA
jgi:phage terminase large subunit-like protein